MSSYNLGKLGIWTSLDNVSWAEAIAFAQEVERLGYGTLWLPEAVGRDPFIMLGTLALNTGTLKLATGIANIYIRDAVGMNAAACTLNELSSGRFVLGLGVSHRELVTTLRQHEYQQPLATMGRYLDQMSGAFYGGPSPASRGPVLVGALRDRMLALSAQKADGAHPYFVPPEHTERARKLLGPGKLLAPEQMVLLCKQPSEARAAARQYIAIYLGLQNYRNNLLTLGFGLEDFEHGGSDRLVDAIVAWGDEKAIMQRVEAHWQAGADHVCIQPLRPDGVNGPHMDAVRAFAPAG